MKKDKSETLSNEAPDFSVGRRDALESMGVVAAAAGLAAAAAPAAMAADARGDSCPGTGITLPPYFKPTDSIKNNNVYYPATGGTTRGAHESSPSVRVGRSTAAHYANVLTGAW